MVETGSKTIKFDCDHCDYFDGMEMWCGFWDIEIETPDDSHCNSGRIWCNDVLYTASK